MKLIQTVVSSAGFRDAASNPERLSLLEDLIKVVVAEKAHLLVVPAGFLSAKAEEDVPALIGEIERRANAAGIAVIGGVDLVGRSAKTSANTDDQVRTGQLPFFGFAVGQLKLPRNSGHPWRQTSVTNSNAELVPAENVPGQERCVTIDGKSMSVFICGELFSRQARKGVCQSRVSLVIDIGHAGMGQGLIPAMRSLAMEGNCSVGHAQHLSDWYGRSLHFVDRQGEQLSVQTTADCLVENDSLWAAWTVRKI